MVETCCGTLGIRINSGGAPVRCPVCRTGIVETVSSHVHATVWGIADDRLEIDKDISGMIEIMLVDTGSVRNHAVFGGYRIKQVNFLIFLATFTVAVARPFGVASSPSRLWGIISRS